MLSIITTFHNSENHILDCLTSVQSIPNNINYSKLSGLSNEVKSKFSLIRPKTMGQALRIDGITPAAAYILLSYVKKYKSKIKIA